ncbi:MAG: alpha/beta hydrolase [Ruthenibacterium sp.]
MKSRGKGGGHRALWGAVYAGTFLAAFAASAAVKLTVRPLVAGAQMQRGGFTGRVYTDLPYGEREANRFDLYVPAGGGKEAYGLVVYLHAGGFTGGDKADDAAMLKWLCQKGYVAAGVNYTLLSGQNPWANVATMSQEIKSSIPAIQAQAEKLGYPLSEMAVAGGSAGGTLALLYAYRDAPQSPIPVKFVFEAVGPASFYPEDWVSYGLDKSPQAAAALFGAMAGRSIPVESMGTQAYDEAVKEISPVLWVDEHTVPTLCAYGAYDKICPIGSARRLADALKAHGVPHDYIELPHSGHGLQNDDRLYAQYLHKLEEYLQVYLGGAPPGAQSAAEG